MIVLLFVTVIVSFAETTNYIHDELNRLIRVVYEDGKIVEYAYDGAGNRLEESIQTDTLLSSDLDQVSMYLSVDSRKP
jgi:YD repeat-containing protein